MRFSKKPAVVLVTERRAWPKPGDISQVFKNLHKNKEYSLLFSSSTRAASDKALNSFHPFWGPPPDPRLSKHLNGSCFLSATQKPWCQEQPWPKNEIWGRAAGLGVSSAPPDQSWAHFYSPSSPATEGRITEHTALIVTLVPKEKPPPTWSAETDSQDMGLRKGFIWEETHSQDTYLGYSLTEANMLDVQYPKAVFPTAFYFQTQLLTVWRNEAAGHKKVN